MSARFAGFRKIRTTIIRPWRDSRLPGYFLSRLRREYFLFPTVHMPSRIYPLAVAQDKNFRHAARVRAPLAALLNLIGIIRIDDCGKAIHLNLGFREFEFHQLAAALRELHGSVENCLAV